MNRKKVFIINLIVFIFIFLLNLDYSKANQKIILAGDKNYPPYEFIDKDGEYIGFNVDIIKALSLEMGKEIKIIPMDWMQAHKELLEGKIDGIQGMSFNEERRKIYNFSEEYLKDSLVIFTLKNNKDINSISNLKGKKVAVQRYGIGAYILSDIGEIEVDYSNNVNDSFKLLRDKKIDAVLANKANALYAIKELSIQNDVRFLADDISPTPYGIAFNKNNTDLPEEFNEAIKSIKTNGTYQKIYEKWFGDIESNDRELLKKTIPFLIAIFLVFGFKYLVVRNVNKSLKEEVKKRTEEIELKNKELQEILVYKEQLINNMRNGLIILSDTGVVSDLNDKVSEILGIDLSNEKGKHFKDSIITSYFNEDKIDLVSNKHIQYNSLERTAYDSSKETIYVYDIFPFYDLNGENIGTLIAVRDMTEIVKLKRKLKQKDKLESLGLLVSSIAHEIRNPLTAIKSYIDLLPKKYDNEKFREKITEQLPVEIDRLDDILTRLLDYSKPKQFKKELWNLKQEAFEIIDFLNTKINEKEAIIDVCIDDEIFIYSDKQQIRQVIINIILNSIDAIDRFGNIKITADSYSDKDIISISDDGEGVNAQDIEYAFDPFYTTKPHGTGLGLSTSYIIMKENFGDIKLSKQNTGTLVELIFYKSEVD